jgi:hypothetical protein
MSRKAQSVVLTKSQAACLIAPRNSTVSKPEIAIYGKLDLIKTATALRATGFNLRPEACSMFPRLNGGAASAGSQFIKTRWRTVLHWHDLISFIFSIRLGENALSKRMALSIPGKAAQGIMCQPIGGTNGREPESVRASVASLQIDH